VCAIARELALVVLADAVEVSLEADALVMSELPAVRSVSPPRLVEKRVEIGRNGRAAASAGVGVRVGSRSR
jgi:hypothetical protein